MPLVTYSQPWFSLPKHCPYQRGQRDEDHPAHGGLAKELPVQQGLPVVGAAAEIEYVIAEEGEASHRDDLKREQN